MEINQEIVINIGYDGLKEMYYFKFFFFEGIVLNFLLLYLLRALSSTFQCWNILLYSNVIVWANIVIIIILAIYQL
jgi:hypothetical protein